MISRFKIDEDLPRQIVDLLTASGYDAVSVVGQHWVGISDNLLWFRVQREARWLVTGDKGFADLRHFRPGTHSGLMLLRARQESRRAYLELARAAVDQLVFDELAGALVVVTDHGIRIRRAGSS
ncbi:MAG: DUF5615 family PIN-like protein [Alphaproteobacteria bacterium]|nr:DUF5615 family PIN-like protein [Alphaproteobacteria bacterium]